MENNVAGVMFAPMAAANAIVSTLIIIALILSDLAPKITLEIGAGSKERVCIHWQPASEKHRHHDP